MWRLNCCLFSATSLCFNESDVFTAEVLAVVINQLLEQTPLPTLLMRTVIQTVALHSKLTGFVINTLSRLVLKQVCNVQYSYDGIVLIQSVILNYWRCSRFGTNQKFGKGS